jgi:surface protein
MKSIIRKSTSIKKIDLSTFDTSKVTNMQDLFEECTSLETVIIDNRDLR